MLPRVILNARRGLATASVAELVRIAFEELGLHASRRM